ncbi:MAG: GNAT family N-acetyltransferase [Candidatus Moranbacteria bacterium]|nr:GNAT family N-acetyltransferase [Candidatus Moranbacteria bacterium]
MATISYSTAKKDLTDLEVTGFFDGWQSKPSEDDLRKSIENAEYIVLAVDNEKNKLVGYITALSDNILSAYIPFLEIEKNYRKQGIGRELIKRMMVQIDHLYMVDLVCDKDVARFYEKFGFSSYHVMIRRNYTNQ